LTITSPRVDSNSCTMGNPMPESTLTLCRVDFITNQGIRIWLLAPVRRYLCKFWNIPNFAFYATTKWVCCLQTGFDVGLVARNILSLIYNFTAKEMLWGLRKWRRVDYLAIMKQVPIIACCRYRKCLPRFSHNGPLLLSPTPLQTSYLPNHDLPDVFV
jgi:hypothetical protein